MAQTIKIRYGADSIEKTFTTNPTVAALKKDANIKAVLGCGDNVKVLSNGVELSDGAVIENTTAEVVFETAANKKAIATA